MSNKVEYHCMSSCNRCGGYNKHSPESLDGYTICEASTKCAECGFEDYWAYGFFELGQEPREDGFGGYDACEKYNFQ